ncbi:hypothetical protein JB92DRAFT_2927115 [Gautieria morchelliformis]|nr:hypothetical protein JB92DRAFT_2927115 [Gautieria morchelliformis]
MSGGSGGVASISSSNKSPSWSSWRAGGRSSSASKSYTHAPLQHIRSPSPPHSEAPDPFGISRPLPPPSSATWRSANIKVRDQRFACKHTCP